MSNQHSQAAYDLTGYQIESVVSHHEHVCVLRAFSQEHKAWVAIKYARTQKGAQGLNKEHAIFKKLAQNKHHNKAHQHVVQCLAFEQDASGMPYLVFEYLESTLSQALIKANEAFSLELIIEHCSKIAEALQSLHAIDYLHGDLHPSNIMLSAQGELKLIDLGAAIHLQEEGFDQHNKSRQGTLAYTAPEAQQGVLSLSYASDVYSFMAVFCAMFTRELAPDSPQVWLDIIEDQQNLNSLNKTDQGALITPGLQELIKQSLSLQAEERPSLIACLDGLKGACIAQAQSDPFTTQVYKLPERLSVQIEKIKSNIVKRLTHQGYLADSDLEALHAEYISLMGEAAPDGLVESLIKEAKHHLSESPQQAAFFAWTSQLLEYISNFGNKITPMQHEKILKQGIQSEAGDEVLLSMWLTRHFDLSHQTKQPSGRHRVFRFIAVFTACCLVAYLALDSQLTLEPSERTKQEEQDKQVEAGETFATVTQKQGAQHGPSQSQTTSSNSQGDNQSPDQPSSETVVVSSFKPRSTEGNPNTSAQTDAMSKELIYKVLDQKSGEEIQLSFIKIGKQSDFYVMREEVSQALWRACVNAGKCRSVKISSTSEKRKRLLAPSHPVINVSWHDVQRDFIPYLNTLFDESFALPSMAQWLHYGFISKTSDKSQVGVSSANDTAMLAAQPNRAKYLHCANCEHPLASDYQGTTMPVVSLASDELGLYHVYGNVQEWLQDCWQEVKLGLERCDQAPAVGGDWLDERTAIENMPYKRLHKTARSITTGFRLVKSDSKSDISTHTQ